MKRDKTPSVHQQALRRSAMLGVFLIVVFAGTFGLWAATTTLSGAVVASGQFVATSDLKKVQHPTGGIVGELKVQDGDRVEQGDLLIRLDETVTRANLQVLTKQMDELITRRARLEAERDGRAVLTPPPELAERADDPLVASLLEAERKLLEARSTAREGQKNQLRKRAGQLQEEIKGLKAQQAAKGHEAAIIATELKGVRQLYEKQLIQMTRLSALEREAANIEGQRGQLTAAVAQAEGRIAEISLQVIQIDEELRANVMKELREVQGRLAELAERRIAAEDQLRRIEIRAPASGYVHQMAVHTVGGVISPGEPVMYIVPHDERYTIEARVAPQDIDQVWVGQDVSVRVAAGNRRTTPELAGVISRASADVSQDKTTGLTFYTVRADVPTKEIRKLNARVQPGMQAEVFIRTGERTPLEYFLQPLRDQVARAFRER